jgi:hypothetical protein
VPVWFTIRSSFSNSCASHKAATMPSASGSTAGPAPWFCLPAKHLRMGLAIAVERVGAIPLLVSAASATHFAEGALKVRSGNARAMASLRNLAIGR